MPNHVGPNTNELGLVFSFDIDDYNSFKGQPGTNLGSGPNFGYAGSGLSEFQNGKLIRWKSYAEKAYIPTLGVKDVKAIEWYNVYSGYGTDGNYTCCPTIFTYSPNGWNSTILEPSTEYMYQIIYKSESGYTHPNYMYHYERSADDSQGTEFGVHSTGRRTHLGDGWYHAWGSFTTQSYTVKGYFGCWHYEYNTKNKVSLAAVSLVKGNTVRPPAQFIDEGATLGNTEALLDLTGNSTIDLSNVSFDANAQITFDGTNDNAPLSTPPLEAGASTYTIEAVFKADSIKTQVIWEQNSSGVTQHQRACMILLSSAVGGFNGQSNDFHSAVPYEVGVWYHWIITVNKNDPTNPIKIYVNGQLHSQGNSSAGASNLNVGNAGAAIGYKLNANSEYFDGEIKLVKVYNRVVSSDEAAQSYNAIKSRFNI